MEDLQNQINDLKNVVENHQHRGYDRSVKMTSKVGMTGQTGYTKGDILVGNAVNALDKLAVGTDGQVLEADSTQTDGVKWANFNSLSNSFTAGEAITANDAMAAGFYQSGGQILMDSATTGTFVGTGASQVLASVVVANNPNRVMVLIVSQGSVAGNITVGAEDYGGAAFTTVDNALGGLGGISTYVKFAPAVGTANVNVTATLNGAFSYFIYVYYNCAQAVDNHGYTTVASASSVSNTLTPVANGCVVVTGFSSGTNSGVTPSALNFHSQTQNSDSWTGDSGVIVPIQGITSSITWSPGAQAGTVMQLSLGPANTVVYGVLRANSANPSSPNYYLYNKTRLNFIGFAISSVSAEASVSITTDGVVTLSGLTPFSTYYLNDTNGTIGTAAGTNSKKIGLALSTTALLIKHDN